MIETPKQPQKLLYSRRLKRFVDRHMVTFNIILFEFVCTSMFAYGVLVALNAAISQTIEGIFASFFIAFSLFLALVIGAPFTGGHFNPAVTFAFMLKKQGRIPVIQGLIYMASQTLGAWIGALFAWILNNIQDAPLTSKIPWKYVWYTFQAQIVGSFLFILFVLVVTTSDTTFCHTRPQLYFFIPTMLLLAREYSYRSQVLNPAFSLAFEFFFAAFNNQWFLFEYAWATILSPFIGAGLAVLFFELFYRKFIIIYKKRQTEEEGYAKLNESEV